MKRWLLPGGFALIILSMLSVAAMALLRMDAINRQLDEIVSEHNVKIGHLMKMYTAARERSVSLLKMTTMEDTFDIVDEFDYFNTLATKFSVERIALDKMPMDETERELFDEHGKIIAVTVPEQLHVIDLLYADRYEEAEHALLTRAIPRQDRVLSHLSEMVEYQWQASRKLLEDTRVVYHNTVRFISIMALVTFLLCLAIAAYVIRRLKRDEEELKAYSDELEQRVRTRTAELERTLQELKDSQSQLVQAEKMASLGQLTAGIAHEIKNPLNFINNFSETSTDTVLELKSVLGELHETLARKDEELVAELLADLESDLARIDNHGKRADGIVKSMLMHAREGDGTREMTPVNALVEEALSLAYHSERARNRKFNVNLVRDLAADTGDIEVNPQEISRVLLNLFSNSFFATVEKSTVMENVDYEPEVRVKTRRENGEIIVEVADNGVGMSEEVMHKVFDPFYTTKPAGEGTGLGLSMSFDIVRHSYGGEFEVESREGEGTCFRFTLPLASAETGAT